MSFNIKTKNRLKSFMALFLAFISAFGTVSMTVFANEAPAQDPIPVIESEPFIARIDGEEVLVEADGTVMINMAGFNEPVEIEIPRYIYFDGVAIPVDDDRIENIAPVYAPPVPTSSRLRARAETTQTSQAPAIGFIVSLSGAIPSNPIVTEIGQEYTHVAYVTMNSQTVSARRYVVIINGVSYEAFCADPNLPGPESNSAVYELTGADGSQFRTVLRYGFPINPALTEELTYDDRSWNAYMTRVAVAYISRPNATWGGITPVTRSAIDNRIAGVGGATAKANSPAISVNDVTNAVLYGDETLSPQFTLRHSRRTNCERNPFRFEWDGSTPAGTRLYVDGNLIATAPTNPTQIFSVNNSGSSFNAASAFHFVMPAGSEGQTARVSLVGINNQYAGRVFVMQNPNDTDAWQDILFYVPEVLAHAAYTWDYAPGDEYGALRIVKRSQQTNQGLAGAVFTVTDSSGTPIPGSPFTTPANGTINITNLPVGAVTITETSPPANYLLSSPTTQTATIIAGQTTPVEVVFVNPPTNGNGNGNGNGYYSSTSVFIEKVDALSRENIPNSTHPNSGALIRLQGMSSMTIVAGDGQSVVFNNTGVNLSQILTANAQVAPPGIPGVTSTVGDGWWRLEGLPYGFYSVVEERAPDGFSLLPQHTAFSFWLHPPDVTIGLNVVETQVVIPWDDVLAMLEDLAGANTPAEDLQAVLDIMTSALGVVELVVIPVFDIEQRPHVNAVHKIFENYPFSEVVVYKRCRITGQGLAGAQFRIEGFFAEGNAPQIIDMVGTTDSSGRLVFRGLPAGGYTISELMPPPGFLLDSPNFQHVNVSWGQIDGHATRPAPILLFQNTPISTLEILKIDGVTGTPLQGAIFELTDPTTGEVWQATSGANGIATFGVGSHGNTLQPNHTYVVREIQSPPGFVLMEGPREVVLSPGEDNRITWHNYSNPGLTIIKTDQDTGERLAGAEFTITAQGSGRPLPTDFPLITGADGTIVIPWTLFEQETERTFLITEVVPPPGYHLADPNWQLVTMQAGYDNTVLFQNRRMPTITIIKRDAQTGEYIDGAEFHIEKIDEPGRGVLTGNPFITGRDGHGPGRITLPFQHAGQYRIVETRAANNYFLDPLEQNRSWIINVRANEDYVLEVFNTLLPTLVITKWNMLTMRPVPLTHFRVEHETPNSPNVRHIGDFVTDRNGQIILPFVSVGWYRVTEIFPAPGMALNVNNNYRVFLNPGDNTYRLLHYIRGSSTSGPQLSDAGIGAVDTNPNPGNPNPNPNPSLPTPQPVDFPFTPAEWEAMNYSARQQFLSSQISVTDGSQWLAPGGQNVFNWPRAKRSSTSTIHLIMALVQIV